MLAVALAVALSFFCRLAQAQTDADSAAADQATDDGVQIADAADSEQIERLLLLAPGQPLRIDLALSIEGRPLRAFWQARIDELFADADHQRHRPVDGRRGGPSGRSGGRRIRPQTAARPDAHRPGGARRGAPSGGSRPDGRIDRQAIYHYLRRIAAPFLVDSGIAPGSAAAPALFGLINANADGQLSRDELAGAAARLIVRDFDDDGLISERELVVDPTQHAERATEEETVARRPKPKAATLLWIGPGAKPARLAAAVLRRYDRDGDGKVQLVAADGAPASSVEMRLSRADIRQFDKSGDGQLDAGELEALVLAPSEIELPLSFGNAAGTGQSSARLPGKSSELRVRKKIDGGYKIYVDDAQIDVNRNNRNPQQNGALEFRFGRLDADKSGYLDMKEAQVEPAIASAFAGMDVEGDGKVMQSEFQTYIDVENSSAAARVRLEVIDRGQDLFAVVDSNGDGLLTPRELTEAVSLIDTEDRNGDGLLSGMEIPARWSLDVARGSSRRDARPVRLRVREATGRRRGRAGLVSQDGSQSRRRRQHGRIPGPAGRFRRRRHQRRRSDQCPGSHRRGRIEMNATLNAVKRLDRWGKWVFWPLAGAITWIFVASFFVKQAPEQGWSADLVRSITPASAIAFSLIFQLYIQIGTLRRCVAELEAAASPARPPGDRTPGSPAPRPTTISASSTFRGWSQRPAADVSRPPPPAPGLNRAGCLI